MKVQIPSAHTQGIKYMIWKTYKEYFQKWLQSALCAVLVLSVCTMYFTWKACTAPDSINFLGSYRFYITEAVLFSAMLGIQLERLLGPDNA